MLRRFIQRIRSKRRPLTCIQTTDQRAEGDHSLSRSKLAVPRAMHEHLTQKRATVSSSITSL